MRVEFQGLQLDLPSDWADITDDLPDNSPQSFASPSGVGALQFSIARYAGGKHPRVSIVALRAMLAKFCNNLSRRFDEPVTNIGKIVSVGCVSYEHEETTGIWYLSNGRDVVLATYTANSIDNPAVASELVEVRQSIASIDF